MIYLLRHAESEENAARVVQMPDARLSERGRWQAERVAGRLSTLPVRRILASDFPRARRTAEAIARATGAPLEFDEGLRERNFGDLRGLPYTEVPADILTPGFNPPGGESWSDFRDRVADGWRRVTQKVSDDGGILVVVTHGMVCRALAADHLTFPGPVDRPGAWHNTGLTRIEASPPWRVQEANCTRHLEESADPGIGESGPRR